MVKRLTNPLASLPTPLGTLLSTAGRRLAGDLDNALRRAGYDDVRSAHASLFMAIDPDGSTVTDLAQRSHMTKQAMGDLVRHLESGGYVSVRVGDADRRARIVELTERGWHALDTGLRVIADFDEWLSGEIGARQVTALRATLDRIITADRPGGTEPAMEQPSGGRRGGAADD